MKCVPLLGMFFANSSAKSHSQGYSLNRSVDKPSVEIGELAHLVNADVLDLHQCRVDARLFGAILKVRNCAVVFLAAARAG